MHGDKPAMHGDEPAMHGDKPAMHGDKPAMHGYKPAMHGYKPAMHGDKPAMHGDKPSGSLPIAGGTSRYSASRGRFLSDFPPGILGSSDRGGFGNEVMEASTLKGVSVNVMPISHLQ